MAGKVLNGAVYGMLGLAAIAAIWALCKYWNLLPEETLKTTLITIYQYAWLAAGIIAALAVLLRIVLAPFVKSEEQELFEQKVDYVLQHKLEKSTQNNQKDYSPLRQLTPEQQDIVIQVFRDLPGNATKPTAINLAMVARYLTAMEQLGIINLSDRHNLRWWVQQVTGKDIPSSSQFNEALPNKNKKEVLKTRTLLLQLLHLNTTPDNLSTDEINNAM